MVAFTNILLSCQSDFAEQIIIQKIQNISVKRENITATHKLVTLYLYKCTLTMCKNEECLSGKNTELHYGISKKKIQQTQQWASLPRSFKTKHMKKKLPGMLRRTKMLVVVMMPIPLVIMNAG